jgi:hypothetical protein
LSSFFRGVFYIKLHPTSNSRVHSFHSLIKLLDDILDFMLDTEPTRQEIMNAFKGFAELTAFECNDGDMTLLFDVLAFYFSINFTFSVCIPLAAFSTDYTYLLSEWLRLFGTNQEQVEQVERIIQNGKTIQSSYNTCHGPSV